MSWVSRNSERGLFRTFWNSVLGFTVQNVLEQWRKRPVISVSQGQAASRLNQPERNKIVSLAPGATKLDPTNAASDALVGVRIMLRFKDYGWCVGTIESKVTNRSRRIGKDQISFIAKFDMDKGELTDLSLEACMYDISPSADYQSWLPTTSLGCCWTAREAEQQE